MSVALESAARLNALKSGIEAKTGESYADLTGGVNALIAGFGQGGGLAYDMGEFVFDVDVVNPSNKLVNGVPHKLGAVPDFMVIWTDDFDNLSADNVSPYSKKAVVLAVRADGLTGMYQRYTTAATAQDKVFALNGELQVNDYRLYPLAPTSESYAAFKRSETVFYLPQVGSATYYLAGITYKYFVAKAWW